MPSKTITITETEVDPKVDVIALGELVTEACSLLLQNLHPLLNKRYLQRIKIDGNTYYKVIDTETTIEKIQALIDARKAEAEKKKRSEGADSLLALANTQPAATTAATTNTPPFQAPPSLSIDTQDVCGYVDLTRSN